MNLIEARRLIEDNLVDNSFEIARCANMVNEITDRINEVETEIFKIQSPNMTQEERDQVATMWKVVRKQQSSRSYYKNKMLRLIGVKKSRTA